MNKVSFELISGRRSQPAPSADRAGHGECRKVDDPAALKRLPKSALREVSDQLREEILNTVSRRGGHFGGNLGAVELAVALHYVWNSPKDKIVWDTGHQAYPHKMLTGRRDRLGSIRRKGGLSGFPDRKESPHDAFGVGHAGTAIGAALGMWLASRTDSERCDAIAIVGDAAIGAGSSLEALNHAGECNADLLVIVNCNGMSISPAVGAIQAKLRSATSLSDPGCCHVSAEQPALAAFATTFGFAAFGPIDGHDVEGLIEVLSYLKTLRGPRMLFVNTIKGKGSSAAELDPVRYHAVAGSHLAVADPPQPKRPNFTNVFSSWLLGRAKENAELVAISPAMVEGSGLRELAACYPDRVFDVGISEQHAATLAAGFACAGKRPVLALYSTFAQRAYDQIVHDIALQGLPVLLAIDRAGIVGPDGATHAGSFDLSFLRCLPGMSIASPANIEELPDALDCGLEQDGPVAVRYPRGSSTTPDRLVPNRKPWKVGRGTVMRDGRRIALLNFGPLLEEVLLAGHQLDATVADMRWVKPLDHELIDSIAQSHELLVTIEDNVVAGGAGSGVAELLAAKGIVRRLLHLGLPDRFLSHGDRSQLLSECGLSAEGIESEVRSRLNRSRFPHQEYARK